jgi:uncharacterized membrane protein YtjA (UPF0391 family)
MHRNLCGARCVVAPTMSRAARAGGPGDARMLSWTLTFLIVALFAALFGFTGVAEGAASIARILFTLFLILFAVSLIAGLLGVRAPLL